MTARYKVMCGCECCISAKIMHSSLLTWHDRHIKQLKYRSHNAKNRRSGELYIHIFETYKNSVRPHGYHIYNSSAYMAMEKCVPVPHNIMIYHTLNVYYDFARNPPVLIYLIRRQIKIQQTRVQQYFFMFNTMYHVVLFMAYAHMKKIYMFYVFH